MFCCSKCFADSEIKAIIEGKKTKGNCDFCDAHNVYVYEIDKDTEIAEHFDEILDVYTPVSNLPDDYPRERLDLLKNIFYNKWNLFNIEPDKIYQLLIKLCSERYKSQSALFDGPVGIKQIQDLSYMQENTILKQYTWDDFVQVIKHINRFHSDYINKEKLHHFLRCAEKSHYKGEVLHRARICTDPEGIKREEMGAPPAEKAKAGRVNPTGISVLYLSNTPNTTFYEIRAGIYDYVTVGDFELQRDIKVINLASIDHISPVFGAGNNLFNYTQYALNIDHLKMIAREIAKPLRNENVIDYLPTQYISDFIRSKDYDGIEYISTMTKDGINLAVFDPELFKCIGTKVYDISSISYHSNPV